ncbi:hypothetical protein Bca52824_019991 [Brassica carinata]|uniref:F-box associated beta-propeller type 3 domain-containing protein n=1 Tax=Brassica carinata TaxID=52824 RepID=A0A8X8AY00_BRACI|nr:hypothetical protein Bca52824_019991 [Brassica carinata]
MISYQKITKSRNLQLRHLLRIISEYWVFVLEPGGFWKKVEYDDQPHLPERQGLCINGVIYIPASSHKCRHNRNGGLRVVGLGGGWWNMVEEVSGFEALSEASSG